MAYCRPFWLDGFDLRLLYQWQVHLCHRADSYSHECTLHLGVLLQQVNPPLCFIHIGESADADLAARQHCLDVLRKATEGYKRFYEMATVEGSTSERFEHATRALTEVLASIVMGYLLLLDSFRDARYLKSSQYFVRESIGQVTRHIAALENC